MLRRIASTVLPTYWGVFRILGFEQTTGNGGQQLETAVALTLGDPRRGAQLLRIHSQCLTGDVLKSLRCDCGDQLELAMRSIAEERCGVLIYEHQEVRGIGLVAKLRAYALQDERLDTIAANQGLGFEADSRDFRLPVAVLNHLGIRRVRLLSNSPQQSRALVEGGIDVVARIPCETPPSPHALDYLRSKKERLGHALSLL